MPQLAQPLHHQLKPKTMELTDGILLATGLLCLTALTVVAIFLFKVRRRQRYRWPLTLIHNHLKIKGDIMQFELQAGYEIPFVLGKPIDSEGNVREIEDDTLSITSTNPSAFTIERDEDAEDPDDPFTGKIVWQGEGQGDFVATADADLGEGVKEIELRATGIMLAPGAVGFAPISFGTARPKSKPADESASVGE